MVEMVTKWKNASMELTYQLGRHPTPVEVAAILNIPADQERLINRVMRANQTSSQAVSLDNLLQGTDSLEDRHSEAPDAEVLRESELERIQEFLDALDERQQLVIRRRFGLENTEKKTLKEIGEELGLTRERVRQIEKEAIRKMQLLDRRESRM
jgi:RNA polymerase primary sigma factor